MTKRKRSSKPADESTDDASVKEDMVHVTPDLLAGSPDVFAGKKSAQPATTAEPEPEPEPQPDEPAAEAGPQASEPAGSAESTQIETAAEPEDTTTMAATEPPTAQETSSEPAGSTPPPAAPFVNVTPYPSRLRRVGSSAALGMVLIVVGLFALIVVVAGVDLTQYGWPLFVIIPGLTLLVAGFTSLGSGATIPGGVVTMLMMFVVGRLAARDRAAVRVAARSGADDRRGPRAQRSFGSPSPRIPTSVDGGHSGSRRVGHRLGDEPARTLVQGLA